jgi:hypothetical protein
VVKIIIATLSLLLLGAGPAFSADPIPSWPNDGSSPKFFGAPFTANPVPHTPVPEHPVMSDNGTNSMHNDAYASDGYEVSGPLGKNLKQTSATYGVSECATIAFDSQGRIVGLCGGLMGFTLRLINPTTLDVIAKFDMPGRNWAMTTNLLSDLCGGTYFYLDKNDNAYALTTGNELWKIKVGANSFTHTDTYNLNASIASGDCALAVMPDWSGQIWFATKGGRVGVVNPTTKAVKTIDLPGDEVYNSLATDENGLMFVVTDHRTVALKAPAGTPLIEWSTAYDRGTRVKPGQLSQGSGTTPTLIDDDLVVITDNADPKMHVIFLDRRTGEEKCSVPVFRNNASDTENSLVAVGRSVIVENNYGYSNPFVTLFGQTTTPGIARVDYNNGNCQTAWTAPISAPSAVPKASWGNGLMYTYTKESEAWWFSQWYFTAINVRTGQVAWKMRTGNGLQWNNHYASMYLGPDGAAYAPVMQGLIRLADQP